MADTIRIAFNRRQPPVPKDVYAALERVLGRTACTRCGFDGIDVLMQLEEIAEPAPYPWVASRTGGEVPGV